MAIKIGIFDSGIGGLTVMKAVRALLPQEDITYFGDTARLPYGSKSAATIRRYSIENALFLLEQGVNVIVIACNTAAIVASQMLSNIFKVPILDVVQSNIQQLLQAKAAKKIAVLGTHSTIQSGFYQKYLQTHMPCISVDALACPLFVPLIEENQIARPFAKMITVEMLQTLIENRVDTVLLACTHYSLIKPLIQDVLGKHVQILDCSHNCALQVHAVVQEMKAQYHSVQPATPHIAQSTFFVSDDPDKFRRQGENFLGQPIMHVQQATAFFS